MTILEALRQVTSSIKLWSENKFLNKDNYVVDSKLSDTSKNPVQNKVINSEINNLKTQIGDIDVSEQIESAINEIDYPVDSVNGKNGTVVLTAGDVGIYVQDAEPTDAVDGDMWVDTSKDPSYMEPNIPNTLPNPNELTFTGSVSGSYDGSMAVQIEIPYIPSKTSDLENDSGYITSAPVKSVNGQTGVIEITANSIGAQPAGSYVLQNDIGSMALKDTVSKSDLASDVQKSLGKADSALQSYTETDPTVPSWAKQSSKPTYTASEVGADPSGTAANAVSAHNTQTSSHNDIRLELKSLSDKINAFLDSDDTTLDELSELITAIKNNKTTIEQLTSGKVNVTDIVNNLTTNTANKPLSAAQGVALKSLIDAISVPTKVSQLTNDKGYITGYTETDPTVPAWAKASSKPSYSKSEVGLGNVENVKQYSASNPPPYPVTSVNGKTGAVTVSALPAVTTSDNGKVLMVVNGVWTAVDLNMSIDENGVVSI